MVIILVKLQYIGCFVLLAVWQVGFLENACMTKKGAGSPARWQRKSWTKTSGRRTWRNASGCTNLMKAARIKTGERWEAGRGSDLLATEQGPACIGGGLGRRAMCLWRDANILYKYMYIIYKLVFRFFQEHCVKWACTGQTDRHNDPTHKYIHTYTGR